MEAPPGAVLELVSWVQCDGCGRWRKVPTELADSLSDDVPWYCSNNPDAAHNTCEAPQELTDAEIDRLHAENGQGKEGEHGALAGGGANGAAAAAALLGSVPRHHRRPPVWQLITSNLYTHRERKEQDEDDIMICQCKKIWATDHTTIGCGPECLNRMLNIECVEEYCPSGHRCSNQMFTKREYSKLEVRRAGAKGFGLFAAEDMKAGQFVIEYLGEVLEEEEYHRRKEYFIETGQRHYYFMNVGNGEVIDASRRGNLGRFINHSCEPNCETQKWVVHGELAIGLFTLQDIPVGTELTFDYNFERYGDKPMKCLCASKNCRGVIGGTQDKEGSAATRAAIEAAVEPPPGEQDPDYIMVTEKEHDAALNTILDRVVGLGWEKGWTPKLSQRLHKLADQHGVDLANLSEDEDDDVAMAAASSGMSGEAEEPAAAEAARKPPARKQQARKPTAKQRQQQGKSRKPAGKQRRATVASDEEEWTAEGLEAQAAAPASAETVVRTEEQKEAGEVAEAAARGGTAPVGPSLSDSEAEEEDEEEEEDEDDDEELAALRRVGGRAGGGAQAAAKAAALAASAAQQLPFRRRLKRFARAAAVAEAASTTPAGSTGSRGRLGSASKAGATQSVASSTPAGGGAASGGPLIPKRSTAGMLATPTDRVGFFKRRSEIDRRLDELVNAAGRLRDTHPDVIIRVLRLFNLCEIGPTVSKMDTGEQGELGVPPRPPSAGPQRSDGSGGTLPHTGSASDLRALRPLSRNESGSSLQQQAAAAAALQAAAAASLQQQAAALQGGQAPAAAAPREEGEVTPEPEPLVADQRSQQQHHHLQPPGQPAWAAHPGGLPHQGSSPSKEQRGGERGGEQGRRAEATSRVRAAWDEAQRSGQLSARQSARIADMSLLLDVVLKTNTLSAKKDFIKCGILRQLLGVVGGNTGKQYSVILKKVLRVVESLPLSADDMHHTRSAHGSFADLLRELAQSTDFEIRSKAYGLLKKFPVQNCTRPVAPEVMHSSAGSSRSRPGGALTPGGPGGLPPPAVQQWRDGPLPPLAVPPPPPLGVPGPYGPLPPRDGPPPGASPFGGPPPPGHFHGSPHQQQHDGWRPRDVLPPSRFGPGRPMLGGPMMPGRPGPPMGRPMPPAMLPPPHHHFPQPHPGIGRPPPPPPPTLLQPPGVPGSSATPGPPEGPTAPGSSSRKRSRWDQPVTGTPAAAATDASVTPGAGGQAPGRVPPGFGGSGSGGGSWQWQPSMQGVSPGGAQQEEPPTKRLAADGRPNGSAAAGASTQLESASSWDVESQFALGTAGASYLGAAAAGGGGNLSPDAADAPRGTAHTYSPMASPVQQPAGGGGAGAGAGPTGDGGMGGPGRPLSAAYSHGSGGAAPAGAAAAGALPGGGEPTGNGGGMHVSPMSDDDALPLPAYGSGEQQTAAEAPPPPPPQQQQQLEQQPETWDEPDSSFAMYVADMVRRRVGKYAQPDHPMCISQDTARELYTKIRREIVEKEHQAYEGRQAARVFKPIERSKLESKIREFVRDSIRRHHERRGGY